MKDPKIYQKIIIIIEKVKYFLVRFDSLVILDSNGKQAYGFKDVNIFF